MYSLGSLLFEHSIVSTVWIERYEKILERNLFAKLYHNQPHYVSAAHECTHLQSDQSRAALVSAVISKCAECY